MSMVPAAAGINDNRTSYLMLPAVTGAATSHRHLPPRLLSPTARASQKCPVLSLKS